VNQALNVHIPDIMKKAIAQLPTVREQRARQGAEDEIVEGARRDRQELPQREFLPQFIPFYAATEAFNYFRQQYPDYAYKEVPLIQRIRAIERPTWRWMSWRCSGTIPQREFVGPPRYPRAGRTLYQRAD
jgi:hypothetical protein